ncbi:MAG: dTMP kinase [Kiritimatiellae bacterium]|nr:dTMP kinase [Kiritimatiellia bacterium]
MATGRFITFEGGEGCGKSTQIRLLAERLRAAGKEVLLTREPGGTALAEKIRSLVREESDDPPNSRAETLLFIASRAQVVESVIRPALASGTWVLCDRFADSTFAYQGYGRGLDLEELKRINSFATGGLEPDRTILLNVSPEVSAKRMRAREAATNTDADRMEKAGDSFHSRLRQGFLELAAAEPDRFSVIQADGSVEEVEESVWNSIQPML